MRHGLTLARVTRVELRKMFNTRSGFWLIASIAISAVLATGWRHPVGCRTTS